MNDAYVIGIGLGVLSLAVFYGVLDAWDALKREVSDAFRERR